MPRIPLHRHRYETLCYALCILITLATFSLAAQLAPDHALDALLIDIFGRALYPSVNHHIYRQRWQNASRPSFEQAFSDQPLARERYLALLRQQESPTPYPSDGRLF